MLRAAAGWHCCFDRGFAGRLSVASEMRETRLDLSPLRTALASLDLALAQSKNEFIRDSVIQRFEYCYELSWKSPAPC